MECVDGSGAGGGLEEVIFVKGGGGRGCGAGFDVCGATDCRRGRSSGNADAKAGAGAGAGLIFIGMAAFAMGDRSRSDRARLALVSLEGKRISVSVVGGLWGD